MKIVKRKNFHQKVNVDDLTKLLRRGRNKRIRAAQIWLVPLKIVFNVSRFVSAQLKPVFGGFETRLKFIKFGL